MSFFKNSFSSHNRRALNCLTMIVLFGVSVVHAQFSVAPSQSGEFFNDLRQRAYQFRNGKPAQPQEATTGSDGIYDFTRGEYVGESSDGTGPGALENEAYRSLGQDAYRSGYVGYARRNAGDYTSISGPYQASGTFFAPTYTSDPFMGGKRNLEIGPVGIGLGLSTSLEYNDNITRANTGKISDLIGGAYLSIDALYPITQNNQLTLNTVIGVDHYFNHPDKALNGKGFVLNVAPGSSLAFDLRIGEVVFVFYDRVSVRPQTQDSFAVDNLSIFGVFQNDAGVGANWAINSQFNLSLNYNHSTARALQSNYKVFDRDVDSISSSLAWTPTGTWTLGYETSYSIVNYLQNYNNDGTTFNNGLYVVVPITKSTTLKAAGGYQDFSFSTGGTSGDTNSHLGDLYYNVTLANQLNARVNQHLTFGHESSLNTNSNFITADYVTYGVGFILWRGARLNFSGYYENAKQSGGALKENTEQFGFDTYLSHKLTDLLTLGLGYHYGDTKSNVANRGYKQNAFTADLSYTLSKKMTVALGYRFLTTAADLPSQSFDQNRVIMSMNYNF